MSLLLKLVNYSHTWNLALCTANIVALFLICWLHLLNDKTYTLMFKCNVCAAIVYSKPKFVLQLQRIHFLFVSLLSSLSITSSLTAMKIE